MLIAWTALAVAIACEVVATLSLKHAGEGSPSALALVVAGYAASLVLMLVVLRRIEVSVAYAIWAGVGTAAIALVGMAWLGEPANALKLASIVLVVAGVVGLNLSGAH
jgi:small multidrug resistance pump